MAQTQQKHRNYATVYDLFGSKLIYALNVTVGYDRISITLSMLHVCRDFRILHVKRKYYGDVGMDKVDLKQKWNKLYSKRSLILISTI